MRPLTGIWTGGASLMVKIPLTITFVVFASALIIGLVVIERDWARQRAGLETQTLALARATAAAGRTSVLNKDVWALYRVLSQLQERDPEGIAVAPVVEATFIDPNGIVMAHTNPAGNPVGLPMRTFDELGRAQFDHALAAERAHLLPAELRAAGFVDAVAPIIVDGLTVGSLLLRSSTERLTAQLRRDTVIALAFALGLAVLMSVFGTLISRRMVAPLRALSEGLDAVGRGDLHAVQPVAATDRDEIGHLTVQFNRMVIELVEKRRLEKELADAERLAGLGRFAAGLAHEVNNPLGGMLNCVDTLKQRPEDAALVRKYLPLLDTGLRRIAATMQALLGELRGENRPQPCKAGCLGDLEEMVRSEIGERPITLDWRVDTRDLAGLTLSCTCPHLHQIVLNLTRNAVAVMPAGGRLGLRSRRVASQLVIEVADTGPGLDEQAQSQMFEPFYTTSPDGNGLGLWITYRLVERMAGNIRVESRPKAGTRFTVTLPLTPAGAGAKRANAKREEKEGASRAA
jgi:signal transduction histidine kinase